MPRVIDRYTPTPPARGLTIHLTVSAATTAEHWAEVGDRTVRRLAADRLESLSLGCDPAPDPAHVRAMADVFADATRWAGGGLRRLRLRVPVDAASLAAMVVRSAGTLEVLEAVETLSNVPHFTHHELLTRLEWLSFEIDLSTSTVATSTLARWVPEDRSARCWIQGPLRHLCIVLRNVVSLESVVAAIQRGDVVASRAVRAAALERLVLVARGLSPAGLSNAPWKRIHKWSTVVVDARDPDGRWGTDTVWQTHAETAAWELVDPERLQYTRVQRAEVWHTDHRRRVDRRSVATVAQTGSQWKPPMFTVTVRTEDLDDSNHLTCRTEEAGV